MKAESQPRSWLIAATRRPAAPAAACFMIGIFAHSAVSARPIMWILCALLAAATAWVCFRRHSMSVAAIAVGIFALGVVATQIDAFFFPTNDIGAFTGDQTRLARVELRIDEPPRIINTLVPGHRPMPPRQVARARVF